MEAKTLGAVLRSSAQKWPDRPAQFVSSGGEFSPVTYRQMWDTVRRYASVLVSLGVQRGDRVGLFSENCAEWAYVDWAGYCLGVVVVPIYATLPANQVAAIVADADAKLLVYGASEVGPKVAVKDGVTKVPLRGTPESVHAQSEGEAGTRLTLAAFEAEIDRTDPEDIATLIYTSGTTGEPKGAILPHRAFVHVAWSASHHLPLTQEDTFLCILPMSHVYERVAGQVLPIYLGASIGYAKSIASIASDMLKVRPTVMLCVPRFLESFRDRALDAVGKTSPLRQRIFKLALQQGVRRAKGEFAPLANILDKIAMGKLRERVGGRMRFFVSGGAALATHVAEFYMGTGLNVLQGYGLTESAGGTVINRTDRNRYWTVGFPLDMEVKLAEDGEILLRGPGLFLGYWKRPEETAAVMDAEGWFYTGDIGAWEDSYLKITDRKKDILVLGNGKNVAPQPIENKLKVSDFITEAVLFGDGLEHCVALIIPNFDLVRSTLKLPSDTIFSKDDAVRSLLKKEIDKVNKAGANFEMVKKFAILDAPFSIETGELTPSLKVKRKVVREKYADALRGLQRNG